MGLLTSCLPRKAAITAAALAALALLSRPAAAQSEEERKQARELGDQGKAALARKDFTAAAEMFRKASALVAAPTLNIGLARAEVGLGHLIAARRLYAQVVEGSLEPGAPPAFAKAVKEAAAELADLEPRIPSVVITVNGSTTFEATLDGASLSQGELGQKRPIDPGRHVARATAPLREPVEASFTASEGKASEVRLELVSASQGGSHLPGMIGFGLLGLGVGALAVGGVMGGFALRDRAALATLCSNGACVELQRGQLESYHRESVLAWPALAIGAAGLGAGTAVLILANRGGAVLPRKLGPALIGAGVAGLSLGAATEILALQANAKDAAPCVPMACEDRRAFARETGAVAVVSLAAGGAAVVSGALLIALKKDDPSPPSSAAAVAPEIGPGMIGLSGRF